MYSKPLHPPQCHACRQDVPRLQTCWAVGNSCPCGLTNTDDAGEGDTFALLSLCHAYNFTAHVFVAPEESAKFDGRTRMRPVTINQAHRQRNQVYQRLAFQHFDGLLSDDDAAKQALEIHIENGVDVTFESMSGCDIPHVPVLLVACLLLQRSGGRPLCPMYASDVPVVQCREGCVITHLLSDFSSMFRYIVTDWMPGVVNHFQLPWMCGGVTRAFLERAVIAYRQRAGNATKNKIFLQPCTWYKHIPNFVERNVFPLELEAAQLFRAAIISGDTITFAQLCVEVRMRTLKTRRRAVPAMLCSTTTSPRL